MAGLYHEQFEPGHVFQHAVTRTVTEMDNLLITTLSMNTQPLHPCDRCALMRVQP